MIGGVSSVYNNVASSMLVSNKQSQTEKPTWNGSKAYTYLEDMNKAGLEYGAKATKYYATKTVEAGEISYYYLKGNDK